MVYLIVQFCFPSTVTYIPLEIIFEQFSVGYRFYADNSFYFVASKSGTQAACRSVLIFFSQVILWSEANIEQRKNGVCVCLIRKMFLARIWYVLTE